MQEASVEKQRLLNALHHAVEQKKLSSSKVIDVETGKIVGMEALPLEPRRILIGSSHEVHSHRRRVKTYRLMGCVIRDVCNTIAEWQNKGMNVPRVAVNLSARQFRLKPSWTIFRKS